MPKKENIVDKLIRMIDLFEESHPEIPLDDILIHPADFTKLQLELEKTQCILTPKIKRIPLQDYIVVTFRNKCLISDITFAKKGLIVLFGNQRNGIRFVRRLLKKEG